MLQSALFSDLNVLDFGSAWLQPIQARRSAIQKASFARLADWGRALLTLQPGPDLNNRLLRDIGALDQAGE